MFKTISTFLLLLALFSSCKKGQDVLLPGNAEDFRISFLSSSVVFPRATANVAAFRLYADYINRDSILSLKGFPAGAYPYSFVNGPVIYTRFRAGNRKLIITDLKDSVYLQSQKQFQAHSIYNCYVADDVTVTDSSQIKYKVLYSDDSEPVQAGKIGVRFINLSPDAGTFNAAQELAGGSLKALQPLNFAEPSPFYFFDQKDIVSNNIIPFVLSNTQKGLKLTTGLSFVAGINYVILIKGFAYNKVKTDAQNNDYYFRPSLETINRIVKTSN